MANTEWASNKRQQGTDPRDNGDVHQFSALEVLELLELPSFRRLAGLCRRAGIKPHSGRGRNATYSYREINAMAELRKNDADYEKRPVCSAGPVYRNSGYLIKG